MIFAQPIALQLRFLQTMKEISSEHNTTTIQLMEFASLVSNLVDLLNCSFNLKEGFSQRRTEAYKF